MTCVKSVETVQLTITGTELVEEANLTLGQNLSQCVPMFVTITVDNGGSDYPGKGTLNGFKVNVYNNGGTPAVRVTRYNDDIDMRIFISVYVVEFIDDINVYSGSWSTSSDNASQSIGATIVRNKSFVVATYINSVGTDDANDHLMKVSFNSTTEIGIHRDSGGTGTNSGYWYVVEDSTAQTHFSCQQQLATMTSGSSSKNITFSAVDVDKSFILSSYNMDSSTNAPVWHACEFDLTSSTNVAIRRGSTSYNADIAVQVIELKGANAQVVRESINLDNAIDSINFPFGKVLSENSAAHLGGMGHWSGGVKLTSSGSVTSYPDVKVRCRIDSGYAGVDIRRFANIAEKNIYFTYEAVDFGLPGGGSRRIFIT